MTLAQSEPKAIKIGSTDVKAVYLGSTKVRPSGWRPGANTIAYYPLTSDFVDASGVSSNIVPSNNTSVIGLNYGVNCLNLNGYYATISTIDALTTSNEYTINFWLYRTARFDLMYDDNGSWGGSGIQMYSGASQVRWGNTTDQYSAFGEQPYNQWLHIVLTVLNGEGSIYINNTKTVLKSSGVIAPNHNQAPFIVGGDYALNNQGNGCISRLIIENKGRTAQEVADYYNQTKSNYGL